MPGFKGIPERVLSLAHGTNVIEAARERASQGADTRDFLQAQWDGRQPDDHRRSPRQLRILKSKPPQSGPVDEGDGVEM